MELSMNGMGIIFGLIAVIYILASVFKIVPQYERLVIFRLGKLVKKEGGHGPGLVVVLPLIDSVRRVSVRTVALDVPPQDIITRDNVTLNVNAVVYYRVLDPDRCMVEVEDYLYATSQLAQTTLRSVCGQVELDTILGEREQINDKLQALLDEQTEPWGVKVINVEIKNVDLPKEMQRAMGKQAEAERERRSKIIAAEGELQASKALSQAAAMLASEPVSIQLRYLQTLAEISTENSSTIVFPLPMDLLTHMFVKKNNS